MTSTDPPATYHGDSCYLDISDYIEPDPMEAEGARALEIVRQNEHYNFFPSAMNKKRW